MCPDKHKPGDHKDMKHLYYTPVVDAWAVGVLAYELIIGRPPFDKVWGVGQGGLGGMHRCPYELAVGQPLPIKIGGTNEEGPCAGSRFPSGKFLCLISPLTPQGHKKLTIAEIINGEAYIPPHISEGAAAFIRWALTKDPRQRPTVAQMIDHPWVTVHMKAPVQRMPASLRLLTRTDSFADSRSAFGVPHNPSSGTGGGGGVLGGSGGGPAEMMHHLQVQAVQQSGRMLGHSSSLNAADMMRWRDIADPEAGYGDPVTGVAVPAAATAVKRQSDSGLEGPDGRRPSFAAAARLVSGVSRTMSPAMLSPAMSRNNSGIATAAGGDPFGSPRPMSREELFASLQASAQRLNRSVSLSTRLQTPPSPSHGGGATGGNAAATTAAASPPLSPVRAMQRSPTGGFQRSQSSTLTDGGSQGASPRGGAGSVPQRPGGSVNGVPPPASPHHAMAQTPPSPSRSGAHPQESLGWLRTSGDNVLSQQSPAGGSGSGGGGSGGSGGHRPQPPALMGGSIHRGIGHQAAPFSPSRLSTSFTTPNRGMAGLAAAAAVACQPPSQRLVIPSSGSGTRMLRPSPPPDSASPTGTSPRSNSFSARAAHYHLAAAAAAAVASVGGGGAMQAPVPMVVEGRGGVPSPRSLEDEMDAIIAAAAAVDDGGSSGAGASKAGLFGGIKKVFG